MNLEGLTPSNCTFTSLDTGLLDRLAETTSKDRHHILCRSRKKKDDDPSSRAAVPEEEPILSTTEAPLTEWLGLHFDIYEGDVLVDFTDAAVRFVRTKVDQWFVPFEIHAGKPTNDLARNRILAVS